MADAPQDNPLKVQQKVHELNAQSKLGKWIPADGISALMGFKFGFKKDDSEFMLGAGIPLKVFFNDTTGEIKTFLAELFRD